jgi:hypothetical protein
LDALCARKKRERNFLSMLSNMDESPPAYKKTDKNRPIGGETLDSVFQICYTDSKELAVPKKDGSATQLRAAAHQKPAGAAAEERPVCLFAHRYGKGFCALRW